MCHFFHYAPSVSLFLRFPRMVFLDSLVWPGLLSLCACVSFNAFLCPYCLCSCTIYVYLCLLQIFLNEFVCLCMCVGLNLCCVFLKSYMYVCFCVELNTGTSDFLFQQSCVEPWVWGFDGLAGAGMRSLSIVGETNASWASVTWPNLEKLCSWSPSSSQT